MLKFVWILETWSISQELRNPGIFVVLVGSDGVTWEVEFDPSWESRQTSTFHKISQYINLYLRLIFSTQPVQRVTHGDISDTRHAWRQASRHHNVGDTFVIFIFISGAPIDRSIFYTGNLVGHICCILLPCLTGPRKMVSVVFVVPTHLYFVKFTWCSAATRSCAFLLSPVVRAGREGGPQDEIDQEADKVAGLLGVSPICCVITIFFKLWRQIPIFVIHDWPTTCTVFCGFWSEPVLQLFAFNLHADSRECRLADEYVCQEESWLPHCPGLVGRVEGWCNAALDGSDISILLHFWTLHVKFTRPGNNMKEVPSRVSPPCNLNWRKFCNVSEMIKMDGAQGSKWQAAVCSQ